MMLNNRPRVIIITGGIGTGKSTVVNILRNYGFQIADSDKIVHDSYIIGNDIYNKVLNTFGDRILNEDKTINRQKLGEIVFENNSNLEKLNNIVHVEVFNQINKKVNQCNDKAIFVDIPLAFEEIQNFKKYNFNYDEIWLVYVNPLLQRERLSNRAILEGKDPEDVLKIINKQIPIDKKKKNADEVIYNEGSLEDLKNDIHNLLKKKNLL